jgi:hypothetical protein
MKVRTANLKKYGFEEMKGMIAMIAMIRSPCKVLEWKKEFSK